MPSELGEKIRYYLVKAGYTQQDLASELGVVASTVGHKFSGRNPWKRYELTLTAEFVGLDEERTQELFDLAYQTGSVEGQQERSGAPSDPPHPLSRYSRAEQFKRLIEERTRMFVGRAWIFEEIDAHLRDPNFQSGYIMVQGEPGIGKTALLAHLVKQHGYVHHFNIASQNIRSPREFLANVCAQLIISYGLSHLTLPPEALTDSGFLLQLLGEATEKQQGKPVVIALDALDEADDPGGTAGNNALYLPPALPEGVYVIVTSRQMEADRLFVDQRRDIILRDDDPLNTADVQRYTEDFVQLYPSEMDTAISAWRVENEEFVEIIVGRSQGNFMYLVYVLDDIREGRLTPENVDNIKNLPSGLRAYYEQHWDRMRTVDMDRFDRYYEPVVCILATVREPVTVLHVSELTKLPPPRVTEVVSAWRSFLNWQKNERGELLYHIYHRSFQDFLEDKVGLMGYHGMIVDDELGRIQW